MNRLSSKYPYISILAHDAKALAPTQLPIAPKIPRISLRRPCGTFLLASCYQGQYGNIPLPNKDVRANANANVASSDIFNRTESRLLAIHMLPIDSPSPRLLTATLHSFP